MESEIERERERREKRERERERERDRERERERERKGGREREPLPSPGSVVCVAFAPGDARRLPGAPVSSALYLSGAEGFKAFSFGIMALGVGKCRGSQFELLGLGSGGWLFLV